MDAENTESVTLLEDVRAVEAAIAGALDEDDKLQLSQIVWEAFPTIIEASDYTEKHPYFEDKAEVLYNYILSELSAKEVFLLALNNASSSRYSVRAKLQLSKCMATSLSKLDRKIDRFFLDGLRSHRRMFLFENSELEERDNVKVNQCHTICDYLLSYFNNEARLIGGEGYHYACDFYFSLLAHMMSCKLEVLNLCQQALLQCFSSINEFDNNLMQVIDAQNANLLSSDQQNSWLEVSDESESEDERDDAFREKIGEGYTRCAWNTVGISGLFFLELDENKGSECTSRFPSILCPEESMKLIADRSAILLSNRSNQAIPAKGLEMFKKMLQNFDKEFLCSHDVSQRILQCFLNLITFMLSSPDAANRHRLWLSLSSILDSLEANFRFQMYEGIILYCKSGKAKGIVLDKLRSDTVKLWNENGVFRRPQLTKLLFDTLDNLKLEDLVVDIDAYCSCLIFFRFLLVRDSKNNETGIAAQRAKLYGITDVIRVSVNKLVFDLEQQIKQLDVDIDDEGNCTDSPFVQLRPPRQEVQSIIAESAKLAIINKPFSKQEKHQQDSQEMKQYETIQKDLLNLHLLNDICSQILDHIQE